MSALGEIFPNLEEVLEGIGDRELSELSAAVLAERQSRGGRGPEMRLDSMIETTKLELLRLDREVRERADHDAEILRRTAEDGEARQGVMGYTSAGSRIDERVVQRSGTWERYRQLVYVRDGEFPDEYPEEVV